MLSSREACDFPIRQKKTKKTQPFPGSDSWNAFSISFAVFVELYVTGMYGFKPLYNFLI